MEYFDGGGGQLAFLTQEDQTNTGRKKRKQTTRRPLSALVSIPYLHLDLSQDHVDLFGNHYWELRSPYREGKPPLNTGPAPRCPVRTLLSDILEAEPDEKYYLSQKACLGILRRAEERDKELPEQLEAALKMQAGLSDTDAPVLPPLVFHINQREEAIDLGETAGALMATANMQMQTFVAGFSAGAGSSAGGIGYRAETAPTLKGSAGGNCMPAVVCLNDQGGSIMEVTEEQTGTLRAQEHGHQPLVYENHGIDARYTGPHTVAPTMSARYGTGGNNLPLVEQTAKLFSRQSVDRFAPGSIASTESARQHKDATDLIWQEAEKKTPLLIRRLTPLECERLQGFPDGWTGTSGASDSARYKALGNSVAIPCVGFVLWGALAAACGAVPE